MAAVQLLSLTQEELAAFLRPFDPSAYRARQVAQWLARGAQIQEMTNLPGALRASLAQAAVANPVTIKEVFASRLDMTRKLLYQLTDENLVEGVLMHNRYGDTLCLSTQVGCPDGLPVLRLDAGGARARPHGRGNARPGGGGQPHARAAGAAGT